ncbi:MAG TPA: LacI family DNA-binding transcriptional regulator [Candidatus Methylacidiphilales bacterium]
MKVTIRDLARESGVHHTTVSRALRNDPGVSAATREKLRKLAKKRGYVPDPMLSALMVHRRKSTPRYQATLGWITTHPTRDGWHIHEKVGHFAGAKRRAAELGYGIEVFWLREPGMSDRRATQILAARNIRGLFFIPQPRARVHLDLDWSRFSAVTFSHSLSYPILNTVTNHHFRSMRLVMRKLKRLGYRRIGFVCHPAVAEMSDRNWPAAYWAYQPRPYTLPLPILAERRLTRAAFDRWLAANRPDVVISHDPAVLQWLEEGGLRVPQDIGFVNPARAGGPDRCSAIDENTEEIGATAVDILIEMIHRGERGVPRVPKCHLVEGVWVPGSTVRPMHRGARAGRA